MHLRAEAAGVDQARGASWPQLQDKSLIRPKTIGTRSQSASQASPTFDHKVALVIGVDAYMDDKDPQHSFRNLITPTTDARGMHERLTRAGFSAGKEPILNPTRMQLLESIYKFQGMIEKYQSQWQTCLAVIYYAGHGIMSSSREQYLLPRDAKKIDYLHDGAAATLELYGVKLEGPILRSISGAKAALVMIDACRVQQQQPKTHGALELSPEPAIRAAGGSWSRRSIPNRENLLLCYACDEREAALDNSAFTAAIFEVLFDQPRGLSVFNAMLEIRNHVKKTTEKTKYWQCPEVKTEYKAGLFDFELVPMSGAAAITTAVDSRTKCVSKLLRRLVGTEDIRHRETAAFLLHKKVVDAATAQATVKSIVECGGLAGLKQVIEDKTTASVSLRCLVCRILQMMSDTRALSFSCGAGMVEAGVPTALLGVFMSESSDAPVRKGASDALTALLDLQEVHQSLAQQEYVECLIDRMRQEVGHGGLLDHRVLEPITDCLLILEKLIDGDRATGVPSAITLQLQGYITGSQQRALADICSRVDSLVKDNRLLTDMGPKLADVASRLWVQFVDTPTDTPT